MKCQWEGCNHDCSDGIKEHVEAHAKESQDYVCRWESCSKKNDVLNKYSFMSHMRIHSGDRPYKCQKCTKDFTRADALSKHLKKHETEDRMLQQLVDKIFYRSDVRDFEDFRTSDLLRERQFSIDCVRLLQEELLHIGDSEDTWDDYLG